ncbi:LacI family DNA-binding transcriptional regulator [Nonomuraea sp. NPDC049309]|uniref:LacI family DNA-binding transcriptional regulator n=1 Tax=Nonomuraea sp. NPDC049309 TaxID=3364350 RepID=UPI003723CF6B
MTSATKPATLATVAAAAGVSVATVSKVLNDRGDVAPATRALVRRLLAEHGYVQRQSRAKRGTTVELQLDGRLCGHSAEIVMGAMQEAATSGAALVVTSADHMSDGVSWARGLVDSGRHAVITLVAEPSQAQLDVLLQANLPVVVIDPLNVPASPVTSVGPTNFAGGMAATQHLLSLGHRRIAYLGGPAHAASNQARMHGYRAAMEAAEVPVRPEYVRTPGYCFEDGVREGAVLFDLPEPPTAVFAASDESALGAIQVARGKGLRIPEDISVVGFDDTQIAAMHAPALTTVRQPLREMGAVALRTALRLAAGERIDSRHLELATELIVRDSTRAV